MYDGIDGWMCPRESVRCDIRCRQMSKGRKGSDGEPEQAGPLRWTSTPAQLSTTFRAVTNSPPGQPEEYFCCAETRATHTNINVLSFHPTQEANVSLSA